MANPEQNPSRRGNSEKRLVFDEKRGKWRMESMKETGEVNRGGHSCGQPISKDQKDQMRKGRERYWQERREAGNAPLSQQHADKVSEGLKRYWQQQREQNK